MRVPSRKSRGPLLGLALVAAGVTAQAQAPREAIPVELVNALLGGGGRTAERQYFVGVTPPGWPAALVPGAPVRTLGGMRTARQLVAVFVDSSSRDPLAAYERLIQNAGFARPSSRVWGGFQSGGFQASEGRYSLWCGDSSQVTSSAGSPGGALSYLTVTYGSAPPRSMCSTRGDSPLTERERDPRFAMLAIPVLYPPPGVTSRGSGGGGGGNTLHASTMLDSTSMSPAAVLQHYSAQLVKAGWTALSTSASTSTASQLFEARDDLKRTWHGVLLVIPVGARRDVMLMMARPDDDGGSSSSGALRQQ